MERMDFTVVRVVVRVRRAVVVGLKAAKDRSSPRAAAPRLSRGYCEVRRSDQVLLRASGPRSQRRLRRGDGAEVLDES